MVLEIPVAEHLEFLQADNFFVNNDGDWWLGDFGSTIKTSEPILSTTQLFNPSRSLLGTPAMPQYDWDMLAVALIKEFSKHTSEDAWKAALIADGCTPQHKLMPASRHVKHPELQSMLQKLLCCAKYIWQAPEFDVANRHVLNV